MGCVRDLDGGANGVLQQSQQFFGFLPVAVVLFVGRECVVVGLLYPLHLYAVGVGVAVEAVYACASCAGCRDEDVALFLFEVGEVGLNDGQVVPAGSDADGLVVVAECLLRVFLPGL